MSRVAITDLVAGDTAESADVNATLSSWNTALGTGAVGANNIRPEGLDRRTLSASAAAIYSAGKGLSPYYSSNDTSGPVSSGAFAVITLGAGGPMQVGQTIPAGANDKFLVTGAVQLVATNNTLVEVIIERSTDAVTWVATTPQRCRFRTKASTNTPACVGYVMVFHLGTGNTAYYYRLAYATSGGATVTFNNGTLYVEDFAR